MDAQTGGSLPDRTDVAVIRRSGTFWSIVLAVGAATTSQGMMIPLLAVLDPAGSGSASGGAATAGIYGGLLFSMVFMERVVRRVGFRIAVCGGLVLGAVSVLLFLAGRAWRFLFGMPSEPSITGRKPGWGCSRNRTGGGVRWHCTDSRPGSGLPSTPWG